MSKNTEPVRVLQCVSNMDRAGIETMLMNFYRNVDRNKIQFDFLCNKSKSGDYDEEIKKMGGRIFVSPGLNPFKWFRYQKYMKNLFLEHPEYEIIHCQNEAMGFPALYAAKKSGIPIRISHSHNTVTRFDFKWPIKILYKYLLKFVATDCVACGEDAGKYLFNKSVKIIKNSIDTRKFVFNPYNRNKLRTKMNLNNKFVIGHVGRFEPQKNHLFLIKLFYEYQKNDEDAVLLLIGDGSLKNKIMHEVDVLNIKNKVIFIGNIPNVNEYYDIMDLFILPSLHEGLPVVGVEAQTAGLPCLFSENITREIACNENVEFIKLNEIKHWINSLFKYKYEKRVDLSKNVVLHGYDIKNETKKLYNYYISLIEKKL